MSHSKVHSKGLTIIEVLISTAMLAVLASACLPLIARATHLLHLSAWTEHVSAGADNLYELGKLADDVIAHPKDFSVDEIPATGEFTVGWPEHPDRSHVCVRVLDVASGRSTIDHQWLEFRGSWDVGMVEGRKQVVVYRWRHLERTDVSEQSRPSGGTK